MCVRKRGFVCGNKAAGGRWAEGDRLGIFVSFKKNINNNKGSKEEEDSYVEFFRNGESPSPDWEKVTIYQPTKPLYITVCSNGDLDIELQYLGHQFKNK